MVPDHWSNDAMVSMDRCGLGTVVLLCSVAVNAVSYSTVTTMYFFVAPLWKRFLT